MTTVGMDYRVLPGKERVFEDAFRNVLKALEGAAGHRRTRLYREVEAPAVYLILSEWDEPEAFTPIPRWNEGNNMKSRRDELLKKRPLSPIKGLGRPRAKGERAPRVG